MSLPISSSTNASTAAAASPPPILSVVAAKSAATKVEELALSMLPPNSLDVVCSPTASSPASVIAHTPEAHVIGLDQDVAKLENEVVSLIETKVNHYTVLKSVNALLTLFQHKVIFEIFAKKPDVHTSMPQELKMRMDQLKDDEIEKLCDLQIVKQILKNYQIALEQNKIPCPKKLKFEKLNFEQDSAITQFWQEVQKTGSSSFMRDVAQIHTYRRCNWEAVAPYLGKQIAK